MYFSSCKNDIFTYYSQKLLTEINKSIEVMYENYENHLNILFYFKMMLSAKAAVFFLEHFLLKSVEIRRSLPKDPEYKY